MKEVKQMGMTRMKIDEIDEIIANAEELNRKQEQAIFAYYYTKLKRELELGVITLSTLEGFFLSDEKAARFKSRLTEAIFGKEQCSHLGFYDPYEGEEDEDEELDEETFRIFFADEEEDIDDIPVMFSSLTNNSGILNSNERKAVL